MGIIEDIQSLDLADEVKERMIQSARADLSSKDEELESFRRKDRRGTIENEVSLLSDAFETPQPGLLKFYRRVLLSDDEQPGTVLLSDADLSLSGEEATGSTGREELTTADALRQFVKLLPRNAEGKITLSDQALVGDSNESGTARDNTSDKDEPDTDGARERLGKITGQTVTRTRKRYAGRGGLS